MWPPGLPSGDDQRYSRGYDNQRPDNPWRQSLERESTAITAKRGFGGNFVVTNLDVAKHLVAGKLKPAEKRRDLASG